MELPQELHPILASMSLMGLFHSPCKSVTKPAATDPDIQASDEGGDASNPPSGPASRIARISRGSKYYCLLVGFLSWFQFLRYLPSYWVSVDHHKNMVETRILTTCWYLQCALNVTIVYRGCTKADQLQGFLEALREHCSRYSSFIPSEQQLGQLRSRMNITVIIAWMFNVLNILVVGLAMLELNEASKLYSVTFTEPFGSSWQSKVVSLILCSFTSSAWVFPITFSCGFFSFLRLRFNTLTTNLEAAISGSEESFPPEVEVFRRQHIHLCACVRVLDRMVRNLIMTSYVTNIPLVCFLMYNLVYSSADVFKNGVLGFWLTVNVLNVFFISVWAALVHEEVGRIIFQH